MKIELDADELVSLKNRINELERENHQIYNELKVMLVFSSTRSTHSIRSDHHVQFTENKKERLKFN